MSGYSSTPLAKKLGIKPGFKMHLINAHNYYFDLFIDLRNNIILLDDKKLKKNFIHLFVKNLAELEKNIYTIKNEIEQDGIIWISWYKKSSKIPTDATEEKFAKQHWQMVW